ncbi:unannotated protein [freshwater metagenome]|uniref:Unannotated protein n=1 Tax=freshwater metagenome TaxID=449393 RepID=A0A6J6H9F5_9ZZZZ
MESDGVGILLEFRPHLGELSGDLEIVGDRLEIETCSPDEDRPVAAGFDRLENHPTIRLESRNRVIVVGIDDVDQMMTDLRLFRTRRLRGSDIHTPVDLHRVHGDDFEIVSGSGQIEGQ